jgi:hypothetical protein
VIIPFFGLMLKDLYFIQRACLEPLSNGHLNLAASFGVNGVFKVCGSKW